MFDIKLATHLAELSKMVLTADGSIVRADKNTAKAEIEFSVPVTKSSVGKNLFVTYGDEEVTDFDYSIDAEGKKLTVEIPVGRNGGKDRG